MVISFSEPEPRNFLLEKGTVYTFRENRRKQFLKQSCEDQLRRKGITDWANEGRNKPKIADLVIYEVGEFKATELRPYSDMSGFVSFTGWIEAIKRCFHYNELDSTNKGWLYKVELQRKENG